MTLYMAQLNPAPDALIRFLAGQGLNRSSDSDFGYGIHAWLAATFGDLAPAPFRLHLDPRGARTAKLLAYTQYSREELLDYALTFAEPAAQAVCNLQQDLAVAAFPGPERWLPGRRLGFEVLTCPISRRARSGIERDRFLHQADHTAPDTELNRTQVYSDWLSVQMDGAARIEQVDLGSFQLVSQLRRGQASGATGRPSARLIRPAALLRGVLSVIEGAAFHALLAHGIGRHRAWGYGMLLLKPANR
jgi:CRISPR system Cascade subunit CasE